jgi:hypothetical protein
MALAGINSVRVPQIRSINEAVPLLFRSQLLPQGNARIEAPLCAFSGLPPKNALM